MEFERENDIMEQRQEMMDDAIDDAMDMGLEEEGDEVVEQVLEEIGVDLSQAVRLFGWALHQDCFANILFTRWARHHRDYRLRPVFRRTKSPKQWAVVESIPATTICRQGWTV